MKAEVRVDAAALREFTTAVFTAAGVPADDAALEADVLLWANLRGVDSHGVLRIPVAHHDGNWFADDDTLARCEDNEQLLFRYVDAAGDEPTRQNRANPNGSLRHVAGVCSEAGNVVGLMPHPERFLEVTHHPEWTSRPIDPPHGRLVFESAVQYLH